MTWTQNSLPKARTKALLVEQVDAETVVYDLDSKDVHCLSPLAAAVYECCDGQTAVSRIAELAQERLGEPVIEDEISAAVSQLDERSLLETPPLILREGISRRDLAKKSAKYGAAVASVPLIASIVAPTAMAQSSLIPAGCTGCGGPAANQQCAPEGGSPSSAGHCCQAVSGKDCNKGCCVGENNSCQVSAAGVCSTVLSIAANCGTVVCPPGSDKCCCCPAPNTTPNCPTCAPPPAP